MAKIISVGNISMGGTGKTPFTLLLAKHFVAKGKKVCVLSRGYKGRIGYDTNVISDGKKILIGPDKAADEPYMMAVNCPEAIIITGKERVRYYEYAEKHFKPDIYLLDDGFQHKKMKRDIDICLLDHKRPVSTGLMFPFGYLREPASAIERADIVVFTRSESRDIPEKVKKHTEGKQVFFSKIECVGLYNEDGKSDIELDGKSVYAFAGIASPGKFFKYLKGLGAQLIGKKIYTDHHVYQGRHTYVIERKAREMEADVIVTTEKDYVKLPDDVKKNIYYLKIDINIDDSERLLALLDN
ncbi:MAG: tetraacyldisaccharide 4'-kinase [Denitrovibrio sp.]|nr:MAG: tetraacyldisaccharide 4'-kinase [Denitrovibrio sp.]